MVQQKYREFIWQAVKQVAYWRRIAVRDFTEELITRLRARNFSQARLAKLLDVKPAYVSRILRGSDNFTLETMVKLAMAVGGKVRVHIADIGAETRFIDVYTGESIVDVSVPSLPNTSVRYTLSGHGSSSQSRVTERRRETS